MAKKPTFLDCWLKPETRTDDNIKLESETSTQKRDKKPIIDLIDELQ